MSLSAQLGTVAVGAITTPGTRFGAQGPHVQVPQASANELIASVRDRTYPKDTEARSVCWSANTFWRNVLSGPDPKYSAPTMRVVYRAGVIDRAALVSVEP